MSDVFHKLLAAVALGISLLLLDLGVDQHRHGGSVGWVIVGAVLVLASCYETVRRFRRRR